MLISVLIVLSLFALLGMVELYYEVGEVALSPIISPKTRKNRGVSTDMQTSGSQKALSSHTGVSSPSCPLESARLFVNKRIAKRFGKVGDTFFGTVIDCYEASSETSCDLSKKDDGSVHSSTLWRIRFDDGDEEYFTKDDLNSALRLYAKSKLYDKCKPSPTHGRKRR
mmetsp:Transcript_26429/g.78170  ORF Transcript_26429/g.78170 Transcript_26429/m.78170 type:complete len:168 (-) Transcript_26429:117-620(-)